LSNDLPAHDIPFAAHELAATYKYFPSGTIFLVVVDPGVGSARRGLDLFVMMFLSVGLSLVATWAWLTNWFQWLLLGEVVVAAIVYALMRASLTRTRWPSME